MASFHGRPSGLRKRSRWDEEEEEEAEEDSPLPISRASPASHAPAARHAQADQSSALPVDRAAAAELPPPVARRSAHAADENAAASVDYAAVAESGPRIGRPPHASSMPAARHGKADPKATVPVSYAAMLESPSPLARSAYAPYAPAAHRGKTDRNATISVNYAAMAEEADAQAAFPRTRRSRELSPPDEPAGFCSDWNEALRNGSKYGNGGSYGPGNAGEISPGTQRSSMDRPADGDRHGGRWLSLERRTKTGSPLLSPARRAADVEQDFPRSQRRKMGRHAPLPTRRTTDVRRDLQCSRRKDDSSVDFHPHRYVDLEQDSQHFRRRNRNDPVDVSRDFSSQRTAVIEQGSEHFQRRGRSDPADVSKDFSSQRIAVIEQDSQHFQRRNRNDPVDVSRDFSSQRAAVIEQDSQHVQRRRTNSPTDGSGDCCSPGNVDIEQDSQHIQSREMDIPINGSRDSHSASFSDRQNKPSSSVGEQLGERIVWPPVVIIENTRVGWDSATNKWHGLDNKELKEFLKGINDCEYTKALSLYGPNGHRGKSLVIFRPNELGFTDAQALSESLQRDNRGRESWERAVRGLHFNSMNGWNSKDLVTGDGKRILYGYLATEKDMRNADPLKKVVKRWTTENYAKMVLEPMKITELEKEEARKKIEELEEEAKNKLVAVEQNKSEFGKKVEELKKVDEERQLRKKHEEELQDKHRRDLEARRRRYEDDRIKKLTQFRDQENEIRACLQKHKTQRESEMSDYVDLARKWKDEIDEEKRKHEVRLAGQRQMETMKQMKLDSDLQCKMEKSLQLLDKSIKEKLLKLQEQHNEEIMKSREKIEAERQELLQNKLQELHAIENEMSVAKVATEQMHKEAEERNNECIICFLEFGTEKMERAYYSCNHANVCVECASDLWNKHLEKHVSPMCPTCKTVQITKYSTLPGKIFM